MNIKEELEKYNDYISDIKKIESKIANLKYEEVSISGSNFSINGDIRPKGYMTSNIEKKVINNTDKIVELEAKKDKVKKHIDYLDSLINTLSDYHREITDLKYKYNKTNSQIATIMKREERTVRKALEKILVILDEKCKSYVKVP